MARPSEDVHKLSIIIQRELTRLARKLVGKSDTSVFVEGVKYTQELPKAKSDYAASVSEAILKAYKKQGFLHPSFKTGWIDDDIILDNFQGIIKQLPDQLLRNVKELNDDVVRLTANGAMTQQEAAKQIASKIGSEFKFVSKDGRKWRVDTVTKRMIRDQCKEATRKTSEAIANELDTDVFQVSQHSGARVKCAKDQGKIFSLVGGTFKDLDGKQHKVLSWAESSRGEPDGLFGYNCRHIEYPLVKGFSVPSKIDPMKSLSNRLNRNEIVQKVTT